MKEIFLNPVGIKYKTSGYIKAKTKHKIESTIKIPWVYSYTAQKAEFKYQKNKKRAKVKP